MSRHPLALLFAILLSTSLGAADWPNWRGPRGNGASDEKNLPVRWSATENVAWKAPIGGVGVSSPIVSGDRVFVTSQIGTGVRRPGNHPRLAQGADAAAAGERALAAGAMPATIAPFFVVEAFDRADGTPAVAAPDRGGRRRCPASTTSTTSRARARSPTDRWSTRGSAPARSSRST